MTLLDQVRALVTVDVDSMDPTVAIRHKPCCNMTSNQAIAYFQATQPENTTLIDEAIAYVRAQSPPDATPDEYLQDVVDVLTILLAKIVAPHLSGKVLVQTSPTAAYDSDKTIAHAKKLVSIFEAHGIPKSRVCIKIPATPESIVACHALHSQGIHTLGTCLFSVPQALAAAQAGCIYISPYFHELRAHFDATVPEDLAHMQRVIASIIAALKGTKTLVMPASIINVPEIIALAALRPDHLTISSVLLDQLASLPTVPEDQFIQTTYEPSSTPDTNDYLAGGAVLLKEAFIADPDISRRVVDALAIFGSYEKKLKEFVRSRTLDKEWNGQWP